MIRVSTGMEDVFLDILELLDLVLALLRQTGKDMEVKHHKDKPSVSDILMKFPWRCRAAPVSCSPCPHPGDYTVQW